MVEGTTFGWVVLVGKDYAGTTCMFTRETSDYEKLYSLDVLRVEDRGEDGQVGNASRTPSENLEELKTSKSSTRR